MNDPPSQSFRAVQPGDILAGKYSVEKVLGAGGMGIVVQATHMHLEQRVAIKFLLPDTNHSQETIRRFLQEAKAAARLRGEHVVRVHDTGTLENGSPYIVMECLEGLDLNTLVETRGPLPVRDAVDYVLQACEAIAEAHAAGIIHRDLKPANLFLNRAPDGTRSIKVLDFGISKIAPKPGSAAASAMTKTRALMGSPLYMSPEQMRSTRSVTPKADVWALGVILYELLAGTPPFSADTMPEICARVLAEPLPPLQVARPEVPAELEAVVRRCTEKEPAARLEVAELAAGLAPFGSARGALSAERVARVARGASIPPPAEAPVSRISGESPTAASGSMPSSPSGSVLGLSAARPRTDSAPVLLPAPHVRPAAAATAATFGTTAPPQHTNRRLWLAAAAASLVGAVLVVAIVRRPSAPSASPVAASSTNSTVIPAATATVIPSTASPVSPASSSTKAPVATTDTTPTPVGSLVPSPPASPNPTTPAGVTPAPAPTPLRTNANTKPRAPAAAASAHPKPANATTSGFGGLE